MKGFFGDVPLTRTALQDWKEENDNFAIVPDANWFMIRALYIHTVDRLANKFTLAHLKVVFTFNQKVLKSFLDLQHREWNPS